MGKRRFIMMKYYDLCNIVTTDFRFPGIIHNKEDISRLVKKFKLKVSYPMTEREALNRAIGDALRQIKGDGTDRVFSSRFGVYGFDIREDVKKALEDILEMELPLKEVETWVHKRKTDIDVDNDPLLNGGDLFDTDDPRW